ncbi:uncharacterized protein K02A2.6-like [Dermacentor silvarum]|uniref:uncharacterized protein K02A2.6-like n=1 Tax=Dermacentor silvarum TaxID=543639 RepID=UPI0018977F41|nr:uncharacterized protein K02A2.6-like [Dermacentor silvarum]
MASAFIQPPLHLEAADSDDVDPVKYVLDKFDELYCPYKNVIQAATLFNSIVQKPVTNSANTPPQEQYQQVLDEFPEIFEDIGQLPGLYSIHLREGAVPSVCAPPKIPGALEDKLKMKLKRMEENGVIVPVTEHSEWVHPIVVITKKDGTVRLCLDLRNLNAALKRHLYPIPHPEELFASLSGSTVFSILDAKSAFWQLALDEASSRLCTFTTPWGRYRFVRVPFGLAIAPELFQQAIDEVFQGQVIVKPYFDNILVASRTSVEHMAHLRMVLTIARKNNLKFNKAKLKLRLSAITYLEHRLSNEGLAPDPEKVNSIESMAMPTDKSQLQRLLGMVTYLTKFIRNFSATTMAAHCVSYSRRM